jgi:hypothetical protein
MRTWVVIYQLNTGKVYGWFCKAQSVSQAEQEFWQVMVVPDGRTIKCVAELQSNVIDAYFSLYEGEVQGNA